MGCDVQLEEQRIVLAALNQEIDAYENTMAKLRPRGRTVRDMLSRPTEENYCSNPHRTEIDQIILELAELPTSALEVTAMASMDCAVSDFTALQDRKSKAVDEKDNILLQRISVREGQLVGVNGIATALVERAFALHREVLRYKEGMDLAKELCTPLPSDF